jgi:hypothetical protein
MITDVFAYEHVCLLRFKRFFETSEIENVLRKHSGGIVDLKVEPVYLTTKYHLAEGSRGGAVD